MPLHWEKHKDQGLVEFDDFRGGINISGPASTIEDNECAWTENLFLEGSTGKLRTRWPIVRYSTSATTGSNAVTGLFYWSSKWFLSSNDGSDPTLFYLDTDLAPQEIGGAGNGVLNSSTAPTFAPFYGDLIIASGGVLQKTDISGGVPTTIANVTNAPKGKYIIDKGGRIISGGNSDNPDRISQSWFFDPTDWNSSSGNDPDYYDTEYADVGYQDGLTVVGIKEYGESILVFKSGDSGKKILYLPQLYTGTAVYPKVSKLSETHCPIAHRAVVDIMGRLWIMEERGISTIVGTDTAGKLTVDTMPGHKIGSTFTATSTGFAKVYPPDFQIWFFPNATLNKAYIYHWRHNAWTVFSFGSLTIYSAFFNPSDNYLYFGGSDGYIYKYDRDESTFRDHSSSYPQLHQTKVYDFQPHRRKIVMNPTVFYSTIDSGSARFEVRGGFGSAVEYSDTFTLELEAKRLYDMRDIRLYDTAQGRSEEMRIYKESTSGTQLFRENVNTDNIQFRLEVLSGGVTIDKLIGEIKYVTRKV